MGSNSPQDLQNESYEDDRGPVEIAIVGDLTDNEGELTDRLLSVEPGGECTLYIDSPGGSPYCAMSLMTLMRLRRIRATGVITGECSSATLWPLAACQRRIVTPYSVLLFHPMRWQSEENVGLAEAAEWARHFGQLEKDMDGLLAEMFGVSMELMDKWINPGRYVSGREVAEAGIAELVEFHELDKLQLFGVPGPHLASETASSPASGSPASASSGKGKLAARRPDNARRSSN